MNWKTNVQKSSVKKVLVFIAVSLAVLLLTATAVYQVMLRALQQEVETMNRNTAEELRARFEGAVDQANQQVSQLVSSEEIQFFFSMEDPTVLIDGYYNHISNQLKLMKSDYLDSVTLYAPTYQKLLFSDAANTTLSTRNNVSLEMAQSQSTIYDTDWLDRIPYDERSATNICIRAKCGRWPYYLSVIKYYHRNALEGAAVVNIDLQDLYHYLIANKQESVGIYVVDSTNQLILHQGKRALYTPLETEPTLVHFRPGESFSLIGKNSQYAYTQIHSPSSGFTFVAVTQLGEYTVRISQIQTQFLGIVSIAALLMILIAAYYSIRSRRPLRELRTLLENADPTAHPLSYTEEIRDIADRIISYLQSNTTLQQELDSRLHLLRDTQMLALQAQINPHFLFNTLNVMSMMVESENGDGHPVAQMLQELSRLLRYSLSESQNVRLQEELDYAQRYLAIMKYRYEDFQVTVRVDPLAKACAIPKLVLQPLLENAIQHGFSGCGPDRPRHLHLKVQLLPHTYPDGKALRSVCVEVADNGVGIPTEKLRSLRSCLESVDRISREHIGLSNVAQRFYLLFHTHQQITLDSNPGSGTRVKLIFPAMECPDPPISTQM